MARIAESFDVCGICRTRFIAKAYAQGDVLVAGHAQLCPKCGIPLLCAECDASRTLDQSARTICMDFT
jgi:hypothetical protein